MASGSIPGDFHLRCRGFVSDILEIIDEQADAYRAQLLEIFMEEDAKLAEVARCYKRLEDEKLIYEREAFELKELIKVGSDERSQSQLKLIERRTYERLMSLGASDLKIVELGKRLRRMSSDEQGVEQGDEQGGDLPSAKRTRTQSREQTSIEQ